MTINKKFKARVRERMATTGENYTTARRALESAKVARPDPLCQHAYDRKGTKCAFCGVELGKASP